MAFVGTLPTPPATLSAAALPTPGATVKVTVPNRKPNIQINAPAAVVSPTTVTVTPIVAQADQASYSAPTSGPEQYNDPGAVAEPQYGIYTAPPTLPTISVPSLTATRPEAGYLPDDQSAGLSTLSAPTIAILQRTQLAEITDLTYSPTEIALFNADVPAYVPYTPNQLVLEPLVELDDLTAFASNSPITSSVIADAGEYTVLYDEKTTYLALDAVRAREKIFAAAAAKGFSLPNGVVGAQLGALAEADVRAKSKAHNEAYEEHVIATRKSFLDAINTTLAGYKLVFSRALEATSAQIRVLQLNVRMGAEVFNSAVESYNKQAQVVREYVGAYRAYVSAISTQDEAVVAQIALAKAKLQTSQADWSMYRDQLGLVQTANDVGRLNVEQAALVLKEFEQKVRGYQQNAELAKINIEAFGQHVRSLNEKVQVQLAQLDMYKDEAESAASQFAVAEANVGAYGNFLEADANRVQSYARAVADGVSTFSALAGEYQEYGQAHRSYLQAVAAGISATNSANRAAVNAVESAMQAEAAIQKAKIEVASAKDAQELAGAEFDMRVQAIVAQAFAEQVRIDAGLAAAKATAASSVAQAAASTTSTSARVSDDGNYNQRYSDSGAVSVTETGRRSWNLTTRHEQNAA